MNRKQQNRILAVSLQLLICMSILISTTGCWNRRELTQMAIASAYGFDRQGDMYNVSIQLINAAEIAANKGGGGARLPVYTLQAKGKTIFESVRELTTKSPRKVYASHIRVLVIGEELARSGIAQVLDMVSRDHAFRTDFYIIVARDASAEDLLKTLTPLEKIPSNKLYSSLEATASNWGVGISVDLHELINDLVTRGEQPVLAAVRIKGDPKVGQLPKNVNSVAPLSLLEFQGGAVFRGDVLVGWLSSEETKGYNYMRGDIRSTAVSLACPDGGQIGVEVLRTKHKLNAKVENGRPVIDVEVQVEGNIDEVACTMKIGNNTAIEMLEDQLEKSIQMTLEKVIRKAKKYKSDIFGFGKEIHRTNPKLWKELQDDWNDQFVSLPVRTHVKADIRRTGSVVESFMEELGN